MKPAAKSAVLLLLLSEVWIVACQNSNDPDFSGEIAPCACPADCSCDDFVIDCKGRGLRKIPSILSQCNWNTVKTLDLSGNSISVVPENAFVGLPRLLNLYLYSSNVREVHPDAFEGLYNLLLLSLDDNNIQSIDKRTFQTVPLLRTLLLHENVLNSSGLPPGVFDDLEDLEILALYRNQLTTVEGLFQNLTSLRELYLFSNQIANVADLGPMSSLQILYLSDNRITEIVSSSFSGLGSLVTLLLSSNQIQSLSDQAFSKNQNLQILYLDVNELQSIGRQHFQHLSNLRILNIADNNVVTVEDGAFTSNSQMEDLYLERNDISLLTQEMFTGLLHLRRLYLQQNEITSIPARTFHNLQELQQLWLHTNEIECVNEDGFVGLDYLRLLHLSGNRISFLASNVFQTIPRVEYLILSDNLLDNLDTRPLRNLPRLFQLALFYNSIQILPEDSFFGTENIVYLQWNANERDFSIDNALNCNCQSNWLRDYLVTFSPYFSSVYCADPVPYNGSRIQDVPMDCNSSLEVTTIPFHEGDVYVYEGQCLRLQCKPNKFVNVNWTRLDTELRSDGGVASCGATGEMDSCGNVHVDNSGVMTLSSFIPSDAGYYMCSAANHENDLIVKKIFRVKLLDDSSGSRPDIPPLDCVSRPRPVTTPPTDPPTSFPPQELSSPKISVISPVQQGFRDPPALITFLVNVTGSPPPDVSWLHNGKEIVLGRRYHLTTTGSLFLINSELSDSGLYTVKATSQAGSAEAQFDLYIAFGSACNYGNGCLNNGTCEAFPFCLCPEGVYGDACETVGSPSEPDVPDDDESNPGSGDNYQYSRRRRAVEVRSRRKGALPISLRMKEDVVKSKGWQPREAPESSPSSSIQDVTKQSRGEVDPKPVRKMPSYNPKVMKPVEIPPPTTRKTAKTSKTGSEGRKWPDSTFKEKPLEPPSSQQLRKLYRQ